MHFVKIFTANFFLSLRSLNFCLRGCYNASLPNRAWSGQCQIYVRNFLEVFFYLLLYKRPFFVTSKINYDRYVIVWTKNIFFFDFQTTNTVHICVWQFWVLKRIDVEKTATEVETNWYSIFFVFLKPFSFLWLLQHCNVFKFF